MSGLGIQNLDNTKWVSKEVYFYEKTGSTNIDAKRLAEGGALHGTIVVAEEQTDGRGRRGRSWQAPAGSNIYFSIVLRPEFATERASMLTLVMAVSVCLGERTEGRLHTRPQQRCRIQRNTLPYTRHRKSRLR